MLQGSTLADFVWQYRGKVPEGELPDQAIIAQSKKGRPKPSFSD
jgi:hypothetical protein